jgi:hypothetical protein
MAAQADSLGNSFGGQILPGAQPQTLQPLKPEFVGTRQHRATNCANLHGGNFSSRAHILSTTYIVNVLIANMY